MVDAGIELVRYFTRGSGNTVDPGAGRFTLEVLALHWLVIGAAWAWIYLGLFRKLCDSHGLSGTLARRYLGLKANAQLPFQVVVIGASGSGKTSFIVRHPAQEIGLADTGKVRGFSFPGAVRSAQYQVVAIDPPGEFLGDHLYYAQEGRADCLVLVVLAKGLDTEQLRITSQGLASSCGSPITANTAKEVLDKFIACWKRPDDERDPKYLRALRLALTRQEIAGAANRKPPLETAETPDGLSTAPVATQANDPAPDSLLAVNDRPKRFCLFLNLDKDFPKFLEEFPLLEWKNGANIQPEHNGLHRVAEAWGRLFGLQPEACRTISGRVDNAYLFERIYDTDFTAKPASPEALPSANVFQ